MAKVCHNMIVILQSIKLHYSNNRQMTFPKTDIAISGGRNYRNYK